MGNLLFKIKCKDCDHEQNIYRGFSRDGNFTKPYYCSNCKELKSVVYKDNAHLDNKQQICDVCGSDLNELNIDMPKIEQGENPTTKPATVTPTVHCPKCKSTNADVFWCGFWD